MTTRVFNSGYQPTLAEFKAHIRVTSNDMDTDLTAKLKSAILSAEHHIGAYIAESTLTLTADFARVLELRGPVISVTSVTLDGVQLEPTDYTLKKDTITFNEGIDGEEVIVVYVAGMSYVPEDISAAILLHAAALFNNPVDSVEMLPKASHVLLRPYRTWGVKDGK